MVLGAGDIIPALERGVVDAVEWSNPASDIPMGFQDVAKYPILPWFSPADHQPAALRAGGRDPGDRQGARPFAGVLQHQKEFARVVATYNTRMRAPYARMVEHYFGKP